MNELEKEKVKCHYCNGMGARDQKLKNLGTCKWEWHYCECDMCSGKGYYERTRRVVSK